MHIFTFITISTEQTGLWQGRASLGLSVHSRCPATVGGMNESLVRGSESQDACLIQYLQDSSSLPQLRTEGLFCIKTEGESFLIWGTPGTETGRGKGHHEKGLSESPNPKHWHSYMQTQPLALFCFDDAALRQEIWKFFLRNWMAPEKNIQIMTLGNTPHRVRCLSNCPVVKLIGWPGSLPHKPPRIFRASFLNMNR